MIDTEELRKLVQEATPGPWYIGRGTYEGRNIYSVEAVTDDEGFTYNPVVATAEDDDVVCWDANARLIAAVNPATINELLDRLEAAERERDECNRRRLEAADHFAAQTALMKKKYDTLRAKIAEMERQAPAYWGPKHAIEGGSTTVIVSKFPVNPTDAPLYALPGAQIAPSIHEGVRKVTLGFRWESEAQHHIPTIEIEFDPVSPDSPNDAKGWQDRDRIASMLSPEAKP